MNNWSETGIGIIYFAGLTISLLFAFAVLYHVWSAHKKGLFAVIGQRYRKLLGRSFKLTVILGTLLGAMSVSFHGCRVDDYKELLSSRFITVNRGCMQVASGANCLSWILLFWLLFFCSYFIVSETESDTDYTD